MLTTQLQAQDPLNPTDTSQMTAQLSQISTVSGLAQVNQSIQQLVQSQLTSQSLSSAGLIGHRVMVSGNGLTLQNGSAIGAVNLGDAADQAKIQVLNAQGQVVDQLTLKSPAAGVTNFHWDGTDLAGQQLPDGNYTFQVTASKGGTAVDATALSYQTVSAITLNQGTTQVMLQNGSKANLSDVQQVAY
jgi:flagellar basal-body rod modification protein FlgD